MIVQQLNRERERETMKDKAIPQTLLAVEWGMQCSRALGNLRQQLDTHRLEQYEAMSNETDPEKVKEHKRTIALFDLVEKWADTGAPWID